MTTTYRSRAADQRTAEAAEFGRDLMCAAQGCPHRCSVDGGRGKLCSWHAWSEPHQWPQITQERLDAMADRAQRSQYKRPPAPAASMSKAEKLAALRSLRDAVEAQPRGRIDWARRIVHRSEAGERVGYFALKLARFVTEKLDRRVKA